MEKRVKSEQQGTTEYEESGTIKDDIITTVYKREWPIESCGV